MKSHGKILDLVIVVLAVNIIPRISTILADIIYPSIGHLDPDRVFLWISIHHIFQLLLTLLIMRLYFNTRFEKWGFNLNNLNLSLKIALYFSIGFGISQGVPLLIGYLTNTLSSSGIGHPLTFTNIGGYYLFQGFLSGTCEEPLFRGFVILVLAKSWKSKINVAGIDISIATIIAAILFSYAHIGFDLFPFEITRLSPPQLVYAFILGIVYGEVFDRTKSLLGPILLHNISNVISITYGYLAYILA